MAKRKKKNNTRQIQELMIIEASMYYLTSFLEKAGVIKDNQFVKGADKDFEDIKGAISLGKQLMFILSRVKMDLQQKALDKANKAFNNVKFDDGFNFLVFVLNLLMLYKEQFKNKVYHLPITYDELNTLFDEYFVLGLKDKDQMQIIKDSGDVADMFYEEVLKNG
jgi:hypothetical protein